MINGIDLSHHRQKTNTTLSSRKVLGVAYEHDAIDSIPPSPEITRKDNPRPSFTESEYKLLLKTTRQVVKEGVKVRGISLTMEMYYFIVFMTHSFLRPTESEVFALRHRDITVKDNPRRLEIRVYGKTGFRVAMTTKYCTRLLRPPSDQDSSRSQTRRLCVLPRLSKPIHCIDEM